MTDGITREFIGAERKKLYADGFTHTLPTPPARGNVVETTFKNPQSGALAVESIQYDAGRRNAIGYKITLT